MNTRHVTRMVAGALLSGGVALSGLGPASPADRRAQSVAGTDAQIANLRATLSCEVGTQKTVLGEPV
jgi:hypothetical protein